MPRPRHQSSTINKALKPRLNRQSSPISLEGGSHLLFAVCYRAGTKNKAETSLIDEISKFEDTFFDDFKVDFFENSNLNGLFNKKGKWEDMADGF